MPDIICARSGYEFKEFFGFSEICGYSKDEADYLKKYAAPALNPIRTEKREYLYAVKGGKTVGRLLTWKDDAYIKATGDNCGFFALCDAIDCECPALIDAMMELQRKWGTESVIGPVAPDGSGFFGGISRENVKGIFNSPPMQVNLPDSRGFVIHDEMKSFIISMPEDDRIEKLAEASIRRFGMRAQRLTRGLFSDKLTECIYALSQSPYYARQAERINEYIDRRYSFAVYTGGSCCGYILVMKGKIPRIATLMTAEGTFRAAAAAILLCKVKKALAADGISEAEAGVINPSNAGSMLLAGYVDARPLNTYVTYYSEIK